MQKADLWSCGIILYTIVFGRLPFDARDKHHARKVVAGDYIIPDVPGVSAECVNLIRGLLTPNAEKRITIQEVMATPWFQTNLPPGSLKMNDFYCAFSVPLQQVCWWNPVLRSVALESIPFTT